MRSSVIALMDDDLTNFEPRSCADSGILLALVVGWRSAYSAFWLFLPSMKADVVDYDEQVTHRRREGSLNAFYSWLIKASITAAVGLSGMVLDWSGFDVTKSIQPSAVLQRMFHVFLILPVAFCFSGFLCIWLYRLNRHRMDRIRSDLESVRGKA